MQKDIEIIVKNEDVVTTLVVAIEAGHSPVILESDGMSFLMQVTHAHVKLLDHSRIRYQTVGEAA